MHYFFDTEFHEDGPEKPIRLISIGIVSEKGDEFYAENSDINLLALSPWLQENVVPSLFKPHWYYCDKHNGTLDEQQAMESKCECKKDESAGPRLAYKDIGYSVLQFLGGDSDPKFWAYFADYDWVVFCQLFGAMIHLPKSFPMFCRDLKQEMKRMDVQKPQRFGGMEHNALADARWNLELFKYLKLRGMEPF